MFENSKTYIAIPPGETIKEQLEDRDMSQKEFAQRMDLSEKHVSRLLNGKVGLTHDTALKLESVLGIKAEFWNNLENRYREKLALVKSENEMDEDLSLLNQFPYKEMADLRWIEKESNRKERVKNLRRYFSVASLSLVDHLPAFQIAYRKMGDNSSHGYAQLCWEQQARIAASSLDTERIDLNNLQDSIESIRKMNRTAPAEFIPQLTKLLAESGIALVFLPHLKGTKLQGASMMSGDRIVLAMTLRGKDADRFWFSLFHEISHIINGDLFGDKARSERDMDISAANILIPPQAYAEFVSANDFSKESVVEFAETIDLQPGIVAGRLQNDEKIRHDQLNDLKIRYEFDKTA